MIAVATNKKPDGCCDDGSEILHDPDEGAAALAIKLLATIEEVGAKR